MRVLPEKRRFPVLNQTASSGTAVETVEADLIKYASIEDVRLMRYRVDLATDGVDFTVSVAAGGQADGQGLKLFTFPEGGIWIAAAKLDVDVTPDAGVSATSAVISLGTALAGDADASLTSTEADIVASNTLGDGTLAASTAEAVSLFVGAGANGEGATLDGSATAKDCNLNIAGTWTKASGSTANVNVKGTVEVLYAWLGDD